MSEEKGKYLEEVQPDNQYKISDEAPHDHFSQIPNIVDDMGLTPYAYRLYGHLRRVAGENGKCWQSTSTLAKSCGMSTGTVSKAKEELENVFPPLIRVISKKKDDGSTYHEVFVSDIWKINHDHFNGNPVHMVKGLARSPGETYRSRGESKKNPLIQEEPNSGVPPKIETLSLENQIFAGVEKVTLRDEVEERRLKMVDMANLIDFQAPGAGALAFAFMQTRGIIFTEKQVKAQRNKAKELLDAGVTPKHVIEATKAIMTARQKNGKTYTCADLFSIEKTAISISNPLPSQFQSSERNPLGI